MPKPDLVAETIADLVTSHGSEVVAPRRHYAIAWRDELIPKVADTAQRRRHW